MAVSHEWLFTEPTEQIYIKRGDALGWGDIAEKFSNMLAPGLSKRTHDARWITILSWCLKVSENAPLDDETLNTRKGQNQRYNWLRPLELMWIAHVLSGQNDTKGLQLPGRRAVQRWLDDHETKQANYYKYGLSTDQWNRYRYTGIYGAYRVALRKLHGLTKGGDGWTPGNVGNELAKWLEKRLDDEEAPKINAKISKRIKREPEKYWIEEYCRKWKEIKKKDLPTSSNEMIPLPKTEQKILRRALFEGTECKRRLIVAETIGKVETGKYSKLCMHIATALKKSDDGSDLALLDPFSQFSDSAIDVFNEILNIMHNNGDDTKNAIKKLVEYRILLKKIRLLKAAANNWQIKSAKVRNNTKLDYSSVDELAESISDKNDDEIGILKVLINHHKYNGGGRKWFNLIESDYLEPAIPIIGSNSEPSYYRFRLWELARMAIQCGVIEAGDLPEVLSNEERFDNEILVEED